MQRLEVPVTGGSLVVYRLGEAEPLVLAVHGITSSSRSWLAVARALGDSCSLLAPDLRGRAASRTLPGPYGIETYVRDLLAVLDTAETARPLVLGHSLGAYIVARLAADHPDRVSGAVLVDGGLTIPGSIEVEPQAFIDGFLGPALARLRLHFPSREAYRDWWRAHPAFAGARDVAPEDLAAYADHDLADDHPSAVEEAVRTDAEELLVAADAAARLAVPATLLCAPRGLLDDPNPMQPLPLTEAWAAAAPEQRKALQVPDTNHYTIVLGAAGANAVANAISERL